MYNLLGSSACFRNLHDAGLRAGLAPGPCDYAALKDGYQRFLLGFQPPVTCGSGLLPELVEDPAIELALMDPFVEPAVPNDILEPLTEDVIRAACAARDERYVALRHRQIERGRAGLYAVEPDWGRLLDLTVHRYVCVNVPRNLGGSTARAIGVVWVNTPETATVGDMVEFLVHEMTHHVIFLDDRLHGHTTPRASAPVSAAVSAIRKVPRPVPCVFDSLLVSIEVLSLRRGWTGEPAAPRFHPPSLSLWSSSRDTLESIRAIPAWETLFTPRGRLLLDAAEERLGALEAYARAARAEAQAMAS
ncbi:aKG-HExxH-type peptide beta-hydroxylase [Sorangium sp. So ce131]|uniref:aKG-HExxH-type peptide beta-hydroxylase n=1 Tax=Sorangium sp. So ce131 TaxID=3133282 RepID=UPI003F618F36